MIVGLGKTGLSCARYFSRRGIPFAVMDGNPNPAGLSELLEFAPGVEVSPVDEARLLEAGEIVLSPGVPRFTPAIHNSVVAGVPVTGDVAMFSELAEAPIVAITGSNGKSTVTALVGAMGAACGVDVGVGGNIGTPCLDLLEKGHALYVLEVSSYQLETATNLKSKVATVLNLTPDHLDRYEDANAYFETKVGIYRHCDIAVVSREVMHPLDLGEVERVITFGMGAPKGDDDFGLVKNAGETFLAQGDERLISVDELLIRGGHNQLNVLAALAIGSALDWDMNDMLMAVKKFAGLPHRCEPVATIGGVLYINDSKSTNIGSTRAAVEGLASEGRPIVLILGGQGKGADFSELADLADKVTAVYVYGEDRRRIAAALGDVMKAQSHKTLADVIAAIRGTANPGDTVLLSPGCASLDQFDNFEHRGDVFRSLVTSHDSGDAS